MKNPSEPKFRKINAENENFKNRVGNIAGGKTLLKECGFEEKESFLEMAENADLNRIQEFVSEIEKALMNYL